MEVIMNTKGRNISIWKIGQIPEEYKGKGAYIYDIEPIPILTHKWKAVIEAYQVKLTVTIQNLGTATAYNAHIFAGFDAGGAMVWNAKQSEPFTLSPNYKITQTIYLDIPRGKHTRLLIQIVHNGYSVDQSHSSWFNTN